MSPGSFLIRQVRQNSRKVVERNFGGGGGGGGSRSSSDRRAVATHLYRRPSHLFVFLLLI